MKKKDLKWKTFHNLILVSNNYLRKPYIVSIKTLCKKDYRALKNLHYFGSILLTRFVPQNCDANLSLLFWQILPYITEKQRITKEKNWFLPLKNEFSDFHLPESNPQDIKTSPQNIILSL